MQQVIKDFSVSFYEAGLVPAAHVHLAQPQAAQPPDAAVLRPEVAALQVCGSWCMCRSWVGYTQSCDLRDHVLFSVSAAVHCEQTFRINTACACSQRNRFAIRCDWHPSSCCRTLWHEALTPVQPDNMQCDAAGRAATERHDRCVRERQPARAGGSASACSGGR